MKLSNAIAALLLALPLALPLAAEAGTSGQNPVVMGSSNSGQGGNAIYKTVGPDGEVVFSDKPLAGSQSEQVQMGPINVQPIALPRKLPVRKLSPKDQQRDDDGGYSGPINFAIVSPQNGATIPPGQRFIALQVAIDPMPQSEYSFFAVVDGQAWRGGSSGNSLDISALERGSHSVQAVLTDPGGKVLARSQTITIYVKRPGGTLPDNPSPQATQAPKAPVAPGIPQARPNDN